MATLSFFLPLVAARGDLDYATLQGRYWSSTLSATNPSSARYLYFGSDFVSANYGYTRIDGKSVRPVRKN